MFVMRLARTTGHLLPPENTSQISCAIKNPPKKAGIFICVIDLRCREQDIVNIL